MCWALGVSRSGCYAWRGGERHDSGHLRGIFRTADWTNRPSNCANAAVRTRGSRLPDAAPSLLLAQPDCDSRQSGFEANGVEGDQPIFGITFGQFGEYLGGRRVIGFEQPVRLRVLHDFRRLCA